MTKKTIVWECECGHIDYGLHPPESCKECSSVGTFDRVPDELIPEKEENSILKTKITDDDDDSTEDFPIK